MVRAERESEREGKIHSTENWFHFLCRWIIMFASFCVRLFRWLFERRNLYYSQSSFAPYNYCVWGEFLLWFFAEFVGRLIQPANRGEILESMWRRLLLFLLFDLPSISSRVCYLSRIFMSHSKVNSDESSPVAPHPCSLCLLFVYIAWIIRKIFPNCEEMTVSQTNVNLSSCRERGR